MLDTVLMHHRDTPNVGDLACTPAGYFEFGTSKTLAFGSKVPETKLLVLGGGQTWQACARTALNRSRKARHKVIWGAGIERAAVRSELFPKVCEACDLVSTRCAGQERRGGRYVPCVSAMSEYFDNAAPPQHEVVMFAHSGYSDHIKRLPNVPEISNINVSLKDAISFIASGDTVVTSSYHGTYWALLLGRRVICVPFNRKFKFFPDPPSMASPEGWPDLIGKANRAEGALEKARALNRQFYEDVMNL